VDLLAAIYASPDDDGPRAVYADDLQQRGDPRGELIALQLANRDDDRQAELLRRHRDAWLPAFCARATFRRGFVSQVMLGGDVELDDPAWATVEHIDGDFPDELLARAPLRALRSFSRPRPRPVDWRQLAARGVVLPALAELVATIGANLDPEAARAVCPALRSCTVHAERILPSLLEQVVRLGLDFPTVRVRRPAGDASRWLADHALVVGMIDGGTKYGRIDDLELQAPTGLVHYRWDQLGRAHWGYAVG